MATIGTGAALILRVSHHVPTSTTQDWCLRFWERHEFMITHRIVALVTRPEFLTLVTP